MDALGGEHGWTEADAAGFWEVGDKTLVHCDSAQCPLWQGFKAEEEMLRQTPSASGECDTRAAPSALAGLSFPSFRQLFSATEGPVLASSSAYLSCHVVKLLAIIRPNRCTCQCEPYILSIKP